MRRYTLLILLTCLLTAFYSCGGDAKVKPLMGGIKTAAKTIHEIENDIDDTQQSYANTGQPTSDDEETVQGLEIPAPITNRDEQILRRIGYTVSYNKQTMQPNWVAWHLTKEHLSGSAKRPRKAFHEDEDVPEPRVLDADYYNSGVDRGHLCPAADNKWSEEAMLQSFLFTNICPQDHGLNVGDWNEMENQCRRWAKHYGDIYIVCGPIFYNKQHEKIGKHRIPVPEAFFKVVLRMGKTPHAIGFIYKNESGNRPMGDYVNTVDQVERITGYDFFPSLPDDVEKAVEATADLDEWSE